jgi:hypothetical protein
MQMPLWKIAVIVALGAILAGSLANVAAPHDQVIDNRVDRSMLHDYFDQRAR